MKIDIDLSEIIDEDGNTIRPEFRQELIEMLVVRILKIADGDVRAQVKKDIAAKSAVVIEAAFDGLLDREFVEVDSYGKQAPTTTTLRNRIFTDIQNTLKWKDSNYDSDKSMYTRTVYKFVEAELKKIRAEYNEQINTRVMADAMQYATKQLQDRLGIKTT